MSTLSNVSGRETNMDLETVQIVMLENNHARVVFSYLGEGDLGISFGNAKQLFSKYCAYLYRHQDFFSPKVLIL